MTFHGGAATLLRPRFLPPGSQDAMMVQDSRTQAIARPIPSTRPHWLPQGQRAIRRALAGYLFLLPAFLLFCVFFLYPAGRLFYLSFFDWNMLRSSGSFIGWGNYQSVLANPDFWRALRNTAYFVLNVPIGMALALLIAVALNSIVAGKQLFRAVYFLPAVTPAVPVAMIFMWLFSPDFGFVNYLLRLLGISGPRWLGSPEWAMPSLILLGVWGSVGYKMVIYLAGLSGIPTELYEAATVDGANGWHRFRFVTWPLLTPVSLFILITSTISSFQVFSMIYVMTQGGPLGSTTTVAYMIFQNAFEYFRMGLAAAIAVILLAMLIVLSALQLGVGQKRATNLG